MSAVADLRAMVDRIVNHVADRGGLDAATPGTAERLLLDAASLMSGIAAGLEAASPAFELTREGEET